MRLFGGLIKRLGFKPVKGCSRATLTWCSAVTTGTTSSIGNQTTWARARKTMPERDY